MAALRDMEESETHLPSSSPNHPDDSSASGPPVLENSSGRVGGQFPLQSLHTAGEEARVASKSAGHTPYPNATIPFESGNNEDDDIKCGRCENPITYCHCSPTMLPPQINVNEEDDQEATVSLAETSNKENRPVEVRVGRGMGGEADDGGGVQVHRRRMYAPGTPQRPARRSLSPTPNGFVHN
jgi:hypothetical protein